MMRQLVQPAALEALRAAHAVPASRFATVDGCDVHWIDEGANTRLPPVLLLSAQWLGATHFDAFAAPLAARTRVVRLDLPGHGLSGPLPDGDYSAQGYARLLRAFVARAALRSHVTVGQSHSGIPAALMAAGPACGMAGLVLATSSGMPRDRVGAASADLPSDLPAGSPAWYAARMRGLFRRERSEADFAAIVAAARAFGELKGRAAESALRLRQFDPELMQRVLPEITLPTLVLWSQASTYLPAEMARTITTQLPDCRGCAVIPQTGHLLLADAPSDAADLILSFLETLALETSA